MRYKVKPELKAKCCWFPRWEKTGKWLIIDIEDETEFLVFDSEEEAEEWVKQNEY